MEVPASAPNRLLRASLPLLSALCACTPELPQGKGSGPESPPGAVVGYPKGTWRYDPALRRDVTLNVAHIVVRHRDSDPRSSLLRERGWNPEPPLERSRQQALERAQEVAAKARLSPQRFADLAAEYSDDVVTSAQGGALGNVAAHRLPPEFLDALAELKVGAVSHVVETAWGYHVIKRGPVQASEHIAFRCITIAHGSSRPGWPREGRDGQRSRAAAGELARRVAREAQAQPERFAELALEHSDAPNASRGGDYGVFWTHRPFEDAGHDLTAVGRHLRLLAPLPIGGVTQAFDTRLGYAVCQRTADIERPTYAISEIFFPDDEASKSLRDNAKLKMEELPIDRTQADEVAAILREHPERFEALQQQHWRPSRYAWVPGRGGPRLEPLTELVASLQLGEVAPEPLKLGIGYRIIKRIEPPPAADPPAIAFEIPKPQAPDVIKLLARAPAHMITTVAQQIVPTATERLALSGEEAATFASMHHELGRKLGPMRLDERGPYIDAWRKRLSELLGEARFARYEAFTLEWTSKQLMDRI